MTSRTRNWLALAVLVALAACENPTSYGPDLQQVVTEQRRSTGTLVEIKFREDLQLRVGAQGRLRSERGANVADLQATLDRLDAQEMRPLVTLQAERLAALVAEAQARSAEPVPDMASWHQFVLPLGTDIDNALAELRVRPEVASVYLAPRPAPPPTTPDFTAYQTTYFGAPPSGTENLYARSLTGGRGVGVELVDLEYDWNLNHEDLGLSPSILITGGRAPSDTNTPHGTAVLGILVGRDNGLGVTGGSPDATIRLASPIYGGDYKPADAITTAAGAMVAGDVLLVEQQAAGPPADTNYIPLEWIPSVFQAIQLATQAGRVVIEPAGNGGRNLDSPIYRWSYPYYQGPWFDPANHNSHAIIVGSGDQSNARRPSSSYGSRVDVQALGTGVTTAGYGGLYGTTANDQYTASFGGTSSASAIVAAAATMLQGYQRYHARPVLTPQGMAGLFKSTGSSQTGNTSEHIGPKPNLRAAILELDNPFDAGILGPSIIETEGYYTYSASVAGGTPPYGYHWYVWWHYNSPGTWQDRGTGSTMTIFVAANEGDFDVWLQVTSADGRVRNPTMTVQNLAGCGGDLC